MTQAAARSSATTKDNLEEFSLVRGGPLLLGGELLRSGVPLQYYFSGFGLVVLLAAAATFTLSARVASAD